MDIPIPNTTNTLLIDKETSQAIGYVRKLSLHFNVAKIHITADWSVINLTLGTNKKYKGTVSSLKWAQGDPMYLTVEVTKIKETQETNLKETQEKETT